MGIHDLHAHLFCAAFAMRCVHYWFVLMVCIDICGCASGRYTA
jgi:hypothetical protein